MYVCMYVSMYDASTISLGGSISFFRSLDSIEQLVLVSTIIAALLMLLLFSIWSAENTCMLSILSMLPKSSSSSSSFGSKWVRSPARRGLVSRGR